MELQWFVMLEGGGNEDVSLVLSTRGDAHRQREVAPSNVKCISISEVEVRSGVGDRRNHDVLNGGV